MALARGLKILEVMYYLAVPALPLNHDLLRLLVIEVAQCDGRFNKFQNWQLQGTVGFIFAKTGVFNIS